MNRCIMALSSLLNQTQEWVFRGPKADSRITW
ncbi:hypothetical protein C8K30_108263 [Promicromonospora sp. AC04]|nr:hypothetical protein C8K30_108263 [Promicromonospora sp. AC04]